MEKFLREKQFRKTFSPIWETEAGIVSDDNDDHPENKNRQKMSLKMELKVRIMMSIQKNRHHQKMLPKMEL
jgi:hypothetical protein